MANTNKDPQFTAYIPVATLDALKASAKREHRSINAQLVLFIEQGLEKEKDMDLTYCIKTILESSIYTAQELQQKIIESGYEKPTAWINDKNECIRMAKEFHAQPHPTGKRYYIVVDENNNEVFSSKDM